MVVAGSRARLGRCSRLGLLLLLSVVHSVHASIWCSERGTPDEYCLDSHGLRVPFDICHTEVFDGTSPTKHDAVSGGDYFPDVDVEPWGRPVKYVAGNDPFIVEQMSAAQRIVTARYESQQCVTVLWSAVESYWSPVWPVQWPTVSVKGVLHPRAPRDSDVAGDVTDSAHTKALCPPGRTYQHLPFQDPWCYGCESGHASGDVWRYSYNDCAACGANTFALPGAIQCTPCAGGTFSQAGAFICCPRNQAPFVVDGGRRAECRPAATAALAQQYDHHATVGKGADVLSGSGAPPRALSSLAVLAFALTAAAAAAAAAA